jgi:hypothetical protein
MILIISEACKLSQLSINKTVHEFYANFEWADDAIQELRKGRRAETLNSCMGTSMANDSVSYRKEFNKEERVRRTKHEWRSSMRSVKAGQLCRLRASQHPVVILVPTNSSMECKF